MPGGVKGSKLVGVSESDEFDAVRRDPDPLRRGRRATELLTLYQQRATELARLRRAAIEEAHQEAGLTYTEIATALGITKGRITQIRGSAPTVERAFFGVGPIAVGVPYRYQTTDRERPLIAAEDARAGEQVEHLLSALGFAVTRFQIEPEEVTLPAADAVVICGPKSAPMVGELLERDPVLSFVQDEGRWWVSEAKTGDRHGSPADDADPETADLAYLARHRLGARTVIHVAGIHAIGSHGALHYLTNNLRHLYGETGEAEFSCIIRSEYDGLTVTASDLAAGPFVW
jgi:hypothetical protein